MKTIAAIATGLVNCAIHIIRVSGDDTYNIVQKICKKPIEKKGYVIQRNHIIDENNKLVDDVLLNTFIQPKSYTGEDTIEINCHGGVIIAKKILNLLVKNGCDLAKNGEFSQRSLLNKKMTYQQVEAVNNLINANNEITVHYAIDSLSGENANIITILREKVFNIIGSLEVNIDYPEYDDVKNWTNNDIIDELKMIYQELNKIIKNTIKLEPIIKGIRIGIIGKPNVGKSSLLNLLTKSNKAIVSNIKGTTRDVIESDVILDNIKITLIDTAGIRKTNNKIEKLGIEKTHEIIKEANIIIHLKDTIDDDLEFNIDKDKIIEVYNKSDLHYYDHKINISIKNNDINDLIKAIRKKMKKINYNNINSLILQSQRQFEIIEKIMLLIDETIDNLKKNQVLDLYIQNLELILHEFDIFLGKELQYDKLDEMFNKFCLGK